MRSYTCPKCNEQCVLFMRNGYSFWVCEKCKLVYYLKRNKEEYLISTADMENE